MMSLLHHNEGYPWLVVRLQLNTGLSYSSQLVLQDVGELTLANLKKGGDMRIG